MKLSELDPRWLTELPDRHGMGISFECPHCQNEPIEDRIQIAVWFSNPIDGKPPASVTCREVIKDNRILAVQPLWNRFGDNFESLTLSPSIDARLSGHWHGNIINGEIKTLG